MHGGLSKATQRMLATMSRDWRPREPSPSRPTCVSDRDRASCANGVAEPTPCVTDDGFEYAGKTYASLTKIAHEITGAHWSGPRFFGLNSEAETGYGSRKLGRASVEAASHG